MPEDGVMPATVRTGTTYDRVIRSCRELGYLTPDVTPGLLEEVLDALKAKDEDFRKIIVEGINNPG